ncbi:MAG: hypothetical protein ABS882_10710, partial [Lysinibacillus sp.]
KADVSKAVERVWTVDYNGQTIEIHNGMMQEKVVVDGVVIDETIRKSIWSHLVPYSTLKGSFTGVDGKQHRLHVKLGGFIKLHVTLKVDGEKIFYTTMDFVMNPWDNKEQIVAYIEKQAKSGYVSEELPDDVLLYDEHHPRKAAGEADQHDADYILPTYTKKLVQLFMAQCEDPTDKKRKATYEKIVDERVVSYFQELLEVMAQTEYEEEKVQREALWLLEHATHREVVKFAITMLGFTKCEAYKEKLQTIALHEEFTGVVLFALRNGATGANDFAFQLAKKLKGWGRVAALDFLEGNTQEVKTWLLTEGYKTTVAPSFVAMLCIEKGKLDVALHEKEISSQLFEGASGLITIMLNYSYERFDMYEYAGQVLMRFTQHAKTHAKTLQHLDTLIHITVYMDRDETEWQELYGFGWKPHERNAVHTAITEIFAAQPLKEEALQIVHSDIEDDEAALEVAAYYGEDVTEVVLQKLEKKPLHLHYYAVILNSEKPERVERLADFIVQQVNFAELSDEEQQAVQFIVSNLHDFEGVGQELLMHCLQGTEDMQYQALMAVEDWSQDLFTTQLNKAIKSVAEESTIKEIRQYARQIIEKQ